MECDLAIAGIGMGVERISKGRSLPWREWHMGHPKEENHSCVQESGALELGTWGLAGSMAGPRPLGTLGPSCEGP